MGLAAIVAELAVSHHVKGARPTAAASAAYGVLKGAGRGWGGRTTTQRRGGGGRGVGQRATGGEEGAGGEAAERSWTASGRKSNS